MTQDANDAKSKGEKSMASWLSCPGVARSRDILEASMNIHLAESKNPAPISQVKPQCFHPMATSPSTARPSWQASRDNWVPSRPISCFIGK